MVVDAFTKAVASFALVIGATILPSAVRAQGAPSDAPPAQLLKFGETSSPLSAVGPAAMASRLEQIQRSVVNHPLAGMAPQAAAGALPTPFSLRSRDSFVTETGGSCFSTCAASHAHCECLQFSGGLNASVLGNAPFSAAMELNLDDCANAPDGNSCCPADGVVVAVNGNNELDMGFWGSYCSFSANSFNFWRFFGTYRIVPPVSGRGSFKSAFGTGSFSVDADASTTGAQSGAFIQATGSVLR